MNKHLDIFIGTILVTCIFIMLKLTSIINWSWLFIFSPIWINILIYLVILVLIIGFKMIVDILD